MITAANGGCVVGRKIISTLFDDATYYSDTNYGALSGSGNLTTTTRTSSGKTVYIFGMSGGIVKDSDNTPGSARLEFFHNGTPVLWYGFTGNMNKDLTVPLVLTGAAGNSYLRLDSSEAGNSHASISLRWAML